MGKEALTDKRIRKMVKSIRRGLSQQVQSIYRLWGMSDTQFCKYMGAELMMEPERVRNFVCNPQRGMHKELLSAELLLSVIQDIFEKYISDDRIDNKIREKAQQNWEKEKEKYIRPCLKNDTA